MLLELVDEAVANGARQYKACELLNIDERTLQRWRKPENEEDGREGPKSPPKNRLTPEEEEQIVEVSNSPEYREVSPKQIVPKLADEGKYIASESSFYRVLRKKQQIAHRQSSKPATKQKPKGYIATQANEVWSWDITYLATTVKGKFFYLYLFMDVWSRKIVGWEVHESESMELSSSLVRRIYVAENVVPGQVVLHSDNGHPMKGSTMVATLEKLGVAASLSRPSVSNDNPYSESLFRTLKYRPEYPNHPFEKPEDAREWVKEFVYWYNEVHLHSGIEFVTPGDRHEGRAQEILKKRREVYEQARQARPERWSKGCRKWEMTEEVYLNHPIEKKEEKERLFEERKEQELEVPSPSASSSSLTQKGMAMIMMGAGTSPSLEA